MLPAAGERFHQAYPLLNVQGQYGTIRRLARRFMVPPPYELFVYAEIFISRLIRVGANVKFGRTWSAGRNFGPGQTVATLS